MNCREFLTEFEERRSALSEWATLHLNDCPDCQKTSGEQTRVWQMIDGLKRVDAPNTFDFRVRARIADSKSSNFQPRFLPALRYILPIGVVVLFLGLIAFNTNYFSNSDASPQVVATAPQPQVETEAASVNSFSSNQTTAVANPSNKTSLANVANMSAEPGDSNRKEELTATNPLPKPRIDTPKKNTEEEEEGGSSRDLAVTRPVEKFPFRVGPNKRNEPSLSNTILKNATDEQILEFYGIKITIENGSRKVQTVEQNTPAGRSGVKAGDVIEAIDGENLSAEPIRTRTFEYKRLTILRGTERVEITLQK